MFFQDVKLTSTITIVLNNNFKSGINEKNVDEYPTAKVYF